jgi:origin recognition complex subunit 4
MHHLENHSSSQLGANNNNPTVTYVTFAPLTIIKMNCVVKTYLLSRLDPTHKPAELIGLSSQRTIIYDILSNCLLNQENNSILCLGPAGGGKRTTIHNCLEALQKDQPDKRFVQVHLNGSLHKDDASTLKEISSQLCSDDVFRPTSSVQDNMNFLTDTLRDLSVKNIPMFIILDDFDQFVCWSKQTLLYNLFDQTQSAHARLVVVGISRRLNVSQSLEKRIKSRFSSREILFPYPSLDQIVEVMKSRLILPYGSSEIPTDYASTFNKNLDTLLLNNKTQPHINSQLKVISIAY